MLECRRALNQGFPGAADSLGRDEEGAGVQVEENDVDEFGCGEDFGWLLLHFGMHVTCEYALILLLLCLLVDDE